MSRRIVAIDETRWRERDALIEKRDGLKRELAALNTKIATTPLCDHAPVCRRCANRRNYLRRHGSPYLTFGQKVVNAIARFDCGATTPYIALLLGASLDKTRAAIQYQRMRGTIQAVGKTSHGISIYKAKEQEFVETSEK